MPHDFDNLTVDELIKKVKHAATAHISQPVRRSTFYSALEYLSQSFVCDQYQARALDQAITVLAKRCLKVR